MVGMEVPYVPIADSLKKKNEKNCYKTEPQGQRPLKFVRISKYNKIFKRTVSFTELLRHTCCEQIEPK
jgi:hypothetical protein